MEGARTHSHADVLFTVATEAREDLVVEVDVQPLAFDIRAYDFVMQLPQLRQFDRIIRELVVATPKTTKRVANDVGEIAGLLHVSHSGSGASFWPRRARVVNAFV